MSAYEGRDPYEDYITIRKELGNFDYNCLKDLARGGSEIIDAMSKSECHLPEYIIAKILPMMMAVLGLLICVAKPKRIALEKLLGFCSKLSLVSKGISAYFHIL